MVNCLSTLASLITVITACSLSLLTWIPNLVDLGEGKVIKRKIQKAFHDF